jgi:hypothetical protein
MKRSRFLAIAVTAMLGGCGREAGLEPARGHALPVRPLMARATPTVDELLTAPTTARPDRIDELVKRSQPRAADPFDLPPPTGGPAPSRPAGTNPGAVTDNSATPNPGE